MTIKKVIKSWKEHCAELDGSKGISNKMIQGAMLKEIEAWRKYNFNKKSSEVKKLEKEIEALTKSKDDWKNMAFSYRKQLLTLKT